MYGFTYNAFIFKMNIKQTAKPYKCSLYAFRKFKNFTAIRSGIVHLIKLYEI